jgi:hypothetical protein
LTADNSRRGVVRRGDVLTVPNIFDSVIPFAFDALRSGLTVPLSLSLSDDEELNDCFSASFSDGFLADLDLTTAVAVSLAFGVAGEGKAESSLAF